MQGVKDKLLPVTVALGLLSGLLTAVAAVYIGGYFMLSGYDPMTGVRYFRTEWPLMIYQPAADVESFLTGNKIELQCWP
jgi:hypothetical protein